MIRYALTCKRDHGFDSWFQSANAFDKLVADGRLTCPVCGTQDVQKALMAPSVQLASLVPGVVAPSDDPPLRPLASKTTELELALAALRKQVEENSDYVGLNFAQEARAIHDGDAPARPIFGEAKADDARKLVEDGVPVMRLPFIPVRKTN